MDPIDDFIARYSREYDYYDQVGRLAQAKLQSTLQEAGIRAIVTSRPKSPGRLREKCNQRHSRNPYDSVDKIYDDIADLVGVRVALYFPGEREQVDGIVNKIFHLVEPRKEFPEKSQPRTGKRFSGYSALHYRARFNERELAESQERYGLAKIEIQVASVLMHAWSEVEHDLDYKPLVGSLSEDEYAILDQLNGLVIAGEIALERLQKAGQRRIVDDGRGFANHYDLANYLLSRTANLIEEPISDSGMGRIDLLFKLLSQLGMTTVEGVSPYLDNLHGDLERRPLAEQLIDALLEEDASRYPVYQQVRLSSGLSPATDEHVEADNTANFLELWNSLERFFRNLYSDRSTGGISGLIKAAVLDERISAQTGLEIDQFRRFRNNLVHGNEPVSANSLNEATQRLREIYDSIV